MPTHERIEVRGSILSLAQIQVRLCNGKEVFSLVTWVEVHYYSSMLWMELVLCPGSLQRQQSQTGQYVDPSQRCRSHWCVQFPSLASASMFIHREGCLDDAHNASRSWLDVRISVIKDTNTPA